MTELHTKAREIAKHLPGWTYAGDDESWLVELKSSAIEDAAILMREEYGRIEVYGHFPKGWSSYRQERPRITMAMHREPSSLAKDVVRRFIPKYLPVYTQACEVVAQVQMREAAVDVVLEELAAKLDTTVMQHNRNYPYYPVTAHGRYYIKARAGWANERVKVDVEIHGLPLDKVERIFDVVRE